jgi:hypothetical protein
MEKLLIGISPINGLSYTPASRRLRSNEAPVDGKHGRGVSTAT